MSPSNLVMQLTGQVILEINNSDFATDGGKLTKVQGDVPYR